MKKWMLICCCERDIMYPEFFNTWDEAHRFMCEEVADALGMSVEEVTESYLNGEELGNNACVIEECAWCETKNHDNCDWRIYNIESWGAYGA